MKRMQHAQNREDGMRYLVVSIAGYVLAEADGWEPRAL